MKCFYHADADGKCAAFWVKWLAGSFLKDGEDEYIKINYGMNFPFDRIKSGEKIYIVDYSLPVEEMKQLLNITKDVTWIDHHKTAIEKYRDFNEPIRGIRYDGIAGCMLTYCYLQHMTKNGEGKIKPFTKDMVNDAPYFTKLIADYDVWTFEYGDDTRYFNMAFESEDFEPESNNWVTLMDRKNESQYIEDGKIMMKYYDNFAKEYCESKGFETEFEGYRVYAMNIGLAGSDWFKSVDDGSYDILMIFSYNGKYKTWSYSMYSKTVDVSEIAKKYGGGGHKGAAGFNLEKLLF